MEEKVRLSTLGGYTAIEAGVSDHEPVVHHGILFFNMMMRGKWNAGRGGYNNAFGIMDESELSYRKRIKTVVALIANIVSLNPSLFAIGLVEAPVKAEDIEVFRNEFAKYACLLKFCESLRPERFSAWGILTLFNRELVEFKHLDLDVPSGLGLEDRVQKFELTDTRAGAKFNLLNLHLPLLLAQKRDPVLMTALRTLCCEPGPKVIMGDFNMDPRAIPDLPRYARGYSPKGNSIFITKHDKELVLERKPETVDGIIEFDPDKLPESAPSLKTDVAADLIRSERLARDVKKEMVVKVIKEAMLFFKEKALVFPMSGELALSY